MVVDVKYEFCWVYGIEIDGGVVLCVSFFIDCEGIVCFQIVNDFLFG